MNKEPLGLYIFRFLMGFGLFAFMCMLYWSSVLIESDMKNVQSNLKEIQTEMSQLRREVSKRTLIPQSKTEGSPQKLSEVVSNYPNILEEDPFYATTLPKMLGEGFKPHGTMRFASVGRPDNLHPFSNWAPVIGWQGLCGLSVAQLQFGKYESYAPNMGLRMELREDAQGRPEFWIYLRDNVYWQPLKSSFFSEDIHLAPHFFERHQVTAHDFKFFVDAIQNPHMQAPGAVALRTYLGDVEEVRVVDDLTFVVRWKTKPINVDGKEVQKMKYIAMQWTGGLKPLASFVYKYFPDGKKIVEDDSDPNTYRTNSLWAQNFMQHWAQNIIVSCGPWMFDGMTERLIKFKRNPDHFNPYEVLVDAREEEFKQSPDVIWQDFKGAKLDSYGLQPNQLLEFENFLNTSQYHKQEGSEGLKINRLDYIMRRYDYIGFNLTKDLFKSKKVRQAITMAVDRKRIINQNLNGMGNEITGTFFIYSPAYDRSIQPWPFDLHRARRLLEEEGWYDSNGDGIIDKEIDGKRVDFRFSLTYYVKNPLTKSICEYISIALKEIGIECNLNGVDLADLSSVVDDKNFDAYMLAWGLGTPPEDPKQVWYSEGAKEKGSSNIVGFVNAEVDEIINQLEYEYDQQKRIALYHRFNHIIYEEAPYIFLFNPKASLLYRDYLQNVFIPADRQDLIPGANVAEPDSSIFWIKESPSKEI